MSTPNAPVELGVQEPWFSAIRDRKKTVEGRVARGKMENIRAGTVLVISKSAPAGANASSSRSRKLVAVVTKVLYYATFNDYLAHEGLNNTLPGVHTLAEGVAVYRQFYSADMEKQHGVAAIHISVIS